MSEVIENCLIPSEEQDFYLNNVESVDDIFELQEKIGSEIYKNYKDPEHNQVSSFYLFQTQKAGNKKDIPSEGLDNLLDAYSDRSENLALNTFLTRSFCRAQELAKLSEKDFDSYKAKFMLPEFDAYINGKLTLEQIKTSLNIFGIELEEAQEHITHYTAEGFRNRLVNTKFSDI